MIQTKYGDKATANSKFGHGGLPQAYLTNSDNKNWRNANTLTYENKKLFNGRDRLNVMIGHEVSTSQDTKKYVTSVDFSKDATTKEILAALGNGTALILALKITCFHSSDVPTTH